MSDRKSVRFRQDQVSVFNGNNCPLSAGFSVRNHRNTQNLSMPIYYDIEPSFVFVEKVATFQSGNLETFRMWVQNNLVYPSDALKKGVSGRVTIQFAVTSKGEVVDVKILRGINASLDNEAYHAVLSSPKWEAAQQGGRAVRQQFVMPIIFTLPTQ